MNKPKVKAEDVVAMTLRLPKSLHDKLMDMKVSEHRSLHAQILFVLEKASKFIVLAIIIMSCGKDHDSFHSDNPEITICLKGIQREADARGVDLDWKGLMVVSFDGSQSSRVSRYDPNSHTMYIDTAGANYKETREELIAHEFGHAILRRQHDFSRLPNGMYKTVMGNFSNRQFSGWSADSILFRKQYYFDELFNEKTPPPQWAL
jgi:hypothetical protein